MIEKTSHVLIKEELLIVLGTSSSESVLPRMMEKMEKMENLGAKKTTVGLVIPTGYFVQSGRHVDLPDDGGGLHCAGHQHADDADAGNHAARRVAADLKRCGGRDGKRN